MGKSKQQKQQQKEEAEQQKEAALQQSIDDYKDAVEAVRATTEISENVEQAQDKLDSIIEDNPELFDVIEDATGEDLAGEVKEALDKVDEYKDMTPGPSAASLLNKAMDKVDQALRLAEIHQDFQQLDEQGVYSDEQREEYKRQMRRVAEGIRSGSATDGKWSNVEELTDEDELQ